jgi:hypothetical protein
MFPSAICRLSAPLAASIFRATLLHGDCEAHIFTDAQLFTPHGRRWLARDRAYN